MKLQGRASGFSRSSMPMSTASEEKNQDYFRENDLIFGKGKYYV